MQPILFNIEVKASLFPKLHNYSLVHENTNVVKILCNLKGMLLFQY
jgi:hypothetical protein